LPAWVLALSHNSDHLQLPMCSFWRCSVPFLHVRLNRILHNKSGHQNHAEVPLAPGTSRSSVANRKLRVGASDHRLLPFPWMAEEGRDGPAG